MRLDIGRHEVTGRSVFELRDGELLVACMYPTEDGLKIVSKYIVNHAELVTIEVQDPAAVLIDLRRGIVEAGDAGAGT